MGVARSEVGSVEYVHNFPAQPISRVHQRGDGGWLAGQSAPITPGRESGCIKIDPFGESKKLGSSDRVHDHATEAPAQVSIRTGEGNA